MRKQGKIKSLEKTRKNGDAKKPDKKNADIGRGERQKKRKKWPTPYIFQNGTFGADCSGKKGQKRCFVKSAEFEPP